jgi:hypothetical protein
VGGERGAVSKSRRKSRPQRGYSDGHPLDEVHYLESKIILKGNRFTSVDSFREFAKLVRDAADRADIDFSRKGFKDALPQTFGSITTPSSCAGV